MSNESGALVGLLFLPAVLAAVVGGAIVVGGAVVVGKGLVLAAQGGMYCGRHLQRRLNDWKQEQDKVRADERARRAQEERELEWVRQREVDERLRREAEARAAAEAAQRSRIQEQLAQERRAQQQARASRQQKEQAWKSEMARLQAEREDARRDAAQRQREAERFLQQQKELEAQLQRMKEKEEAARRKAEVMARQAQTQARKDAWDREMQRLKAEEAARKAEEQRILKALDDMAQARATADNQRTSELASVQRAHSVESEKQYATFLQKQLADAGIQMAGLDAHLLPAESVGRFRQLVAASAAGFAALDFGPAIDSGSKALDLYDTMLAEYGTACASVANKELNLQHQRDAVGLSLYRLDLALQELPDQLAAPLRGEAAGLRAALESRAPAGQSLDNVDALRERSEAALKRVDRVRSTWLVHKKDAEAILNQSLVIRDMLEYDQILHSLVQRDCSAAYQDVNKLIGQAQAKLHERDYASALTTAQQSLRAAEAVQETVLGSLADAQQEVLVQEADSTLKKMGYTVARSTHGNALRLSAWRQGHNIELAFTREGIGYNLDGFEGAACLDEMNSFFETLRQRGLEFEDFTQSQVYRGGPRGSPTQLDEWISHILEHNLGAEDIQKSSGVVGDKYEARFPPEPEKAGQDE